MRKAIIAIFALLLLAGCTQGKVYKIGVSQCSQDDWRTKLNDEINREALFHDNVEVEIRSADDSNEKQIADLRYFVENKFDIIIVAPNEAEALTKPIADIYHSGMPVIVFDRNINDTTYTALQGADNYAIGKDAARYAKSICAQPRVIELFGLPGSTPAVDRGRGFKDEADRIGNFTIVASEPGNWNADDAAPVAEKLLKEHPEANLIYAHNDRMAIAASEVARKMGRRDIKIIGIDASPNIGIKAVMDSVIDATFIYPSEGRMLLNTAVAILTGQPYERINILPTPSAVDLSNAEILMLQEQALEKETSKIEALKANINIYWERYSMQRALLIGSLVILGLLCGLIFLLLRIYWNSKRYHAQIESRNAELSRQRDELDSLYRQLQEATLSKLTFFTNVSHDLRTPLTLIADPVHQLAEADNITADQRTLMQLADKNVKRLQRLVNQILDIRKFDNGKLALHLMRFDVSKAVQEWCKPFAHAARKQHIKFVQNIDLSADFNTAADLEKIERIFFNLLSNAFKFTPENGTISVNLSREGDNILLAVSDSGRGMSDEEKSHVFERFFKTDTVNHNGSGIGLALSKVFAEMHSGTIKAESVVGEGTTMTLVLPVNNAEVETASIAKSVAMAQEDVNEICEIDVEPAAFTEDSPTILVIDDNADIRTLLATHLGEKYTVIQAKSGSQGIRLATKYIPDLIICDVMMPGLDGYETCRRLKHEDITSHIPVLLLTACSTDEQRTEGYECGADGYMSKPFDAAMLMARCNSLIENRKRVLEHSDTAPVAAESKPQAAVASAFDDEFYQRFEAFVLKDLANSEISVEDIAAQLGFSRVQMYRKLKAVTNYSPAELLRNIRLREAARMLKTQSITVAEVSYAVGFTSPSYFTKCFREFFNESPSDLQARTSKIKE